MSETNNITEAEWKIMRIIWANAPTTSNYIIEILKESVHWSPTTIKTLLGRLVKKNIIGFEAKGRIFYYYPLITEEECIKKEMQSLIGRVYGGVINRETAHIQFYGSNIEEYIDLLSNSLESNYERIASDLDYQLTDKVTVYIHSSIKRLHSALGVLNGPSWLRAGWTWGILHIAPAECFTDLSVEKVVIHAFAELIIQKINSNAPYWLHQGIAAYESGWLDRDQIKSILSKNITKKGLSPKQLVLSDSRDFGDNYGYAYAYTVVEYIVKQYGFPKLLILLKAPNYFLDLFHLSEDQFWEDWMHYIKEHYTRRETK